MHAPPSALKTCRSPAESYFRGDKIRRTVTSPRSSPPHNDPLQVSDLCPGLEPHSRPDQPLPASGRAEIQGLRATPAHHDSEAASPGSGGLPLPHRLTRDTPGSAPGHGGKSSMPSKKLVTSALLRGFIWAFARSEEHTSEL